MAGTHALFAPSSAKRLIDCPASLRDTRYLPDDPSFEAVEGSVAHGIAEHCLIHDERPRRFIGFSTEDLLLYGAMSENDLSEREWSLVSHLAVDDEMVASVQEYIDWCHENRGDHYVEQRVNISRWCPVPDQFGTADHATCRSGKLVITDLKYGKGVQVFAAKNYQAILYALGFIDEWDWLYDFDEVSIRICQPRLDHKDVWHTTKAELLEIGEYIRSRFALAISDTPPYGPSEDACKFCRAAATCKALRDHTHSVHALAFDDLSGEWAEPEITFLDIGQLVEAWRMRKLIDIRMKAIEHEVSAAFARGEKVPGLKMVEGRSFRQWLNEERAAQALRVLGAPEDRIYKPRQLISPAQAEKLLRKKAFQHLQGEVVKPPGNPCIVDESDPRPPYTGNRVDVASVFDEID